MSSLLETFLAEAAELLGDVDEGLLQLERDPDDADLINQVFRAAHTIKGSAGLFGFDDLTRLTHAAEDLLDAVRGGQVALDSSMTDDLLAAFDLARRFLAEVTVSGALPADAAASAAGLITRLRAPLTHAEQPAQPSQPAPAQAGAPASADRAPLWVLELGADWLTELADWLSLTGSSVRFARYEPDAGCYFRGQDPMLLVRQVPALERLVLRSPAVEDLDAYDEYSCETVFVMAARAASAELSYLFRYVTDEVEIVDLDGAALRERLDAGAQPDPEPAPARPDGATGDAWTVLEGAWAAAAAAGDQAGGQLAAVVRSVRSAAHLLGLNVDLEQIAQDRPAVRDALRSLLDARAGAAEPGAVVAAPAEPPAVDEAPPAAEPPAGDAAPERAGPDPAGPGTARVGQRVLKVEQDKVDRLMDLVGELIVAKNALPFLANSAEDDYGVRALSRRIKDQYSVINRIAEDLRGGVMDIRMLPLSVAFARFPRLVRDLSRRLGKRVELVTDGGDTMADKDVIEALSDPLVHLVRNSLDHGVELPEVRQAAGKSPDSVIRLAARSVGDAVVVEVSDDGRGIDPARLRRRAYERGVVSEEEAESLTDAQVIDLVFEPGFSTADQVSDLSGRGVGMDAVRASVERLGGSIALTSRPGEGLTASLRLPLSMAVSQLMIVSVGGQRFGLPIETVVESVRVATAVVRRVLHQDVFVIREEVIPLIDLADRLDTPATRGTGIHVVVVNTGTGKAGLVVDRFHREVDAICKPMEGILAGVTVFSGTAQLGDGSVLLVLNVKEVVSGAGRAA